MATLTFEEIDKHIQRADLSAFKKGGIHHFTAADTAVSPADVLQKICPIYRLVRPILATIPLLPIIPKSWKTAIETFLEVMDKICPI